MPPSPKKAPKPAPKPASVPDTATEWRDISTLHPDPLNPHRGDVAAVKVSLQTFGMIDPIIVDREGCIIAGHTRHKAAAEIYGAGESIKLAPSPGMVRVLVVDLPKEEARAYLLANNTTASLGSWDAALLNELRAELPHDLSIDLEALGAGLDLDRLADVDLPAFTTPLAPPAPPPEKPPQAPPAPQQALPPPVVAPPPQSAPTATPTPSVPVPAPPAPEIWRAPQGHEKNSMGVIPADLDKPQPAQKIIKVGELSTVIRGDLYVQLERLVRIHVGAGGSPDEVLNEVIDKGLERYGRDV